MKKIFVILLLIIVGLLAYIAFKPQPPLVYQDQIVPSEQTGTTQNQEQSDWKTYINAKHGFSFQYPSDWSQRGDESEAVCDSKTGATCSFMVDFMDTYSQGIERYDSSNKQIVTAKDQLHVEYNFTPKGAEIYQYNLSQYNASQGPYASDKRQLVVDGATAIEANKTISVDGRGNSIFPERTITVSFLDKTKTGSFNLFFKTPVQNADAEIAKFNQLLSTFKF